MSVSGPTVKVLLWGTGRPAFRFLLHKDYAGALNTFLMFVSIFKVQLSLLAFSRFPC